MKHELISGREFNKALFELKEIRVIEFTDEVAPKEKGVELEDLSNDRDGSVVGWLENDGVYKVSTQNEGQKIIFNEDCKKMFADFLHLKEIEFCMIDTTHVTDMSEMFDECEELEKLDLSGFDTSKVKYMNGMFAWCKNLKELDLSGFDTLNVTDMSEMFAGCVNLRELDLSHFDTSNVRDKTEMFRNCKCSKNFKL